MDMPAPPAAVSQADHGSALEVLRVFLRLGLTSFGGPVAHLGYFRAEFVERRRWLDEPAFADIVALCQFLPGPASSQVGISLGILRAGLPGALTAWLGFTTPSALAMILFGYGVTAFADLSQAAWLHGLKIVAVAVVAQAVSGMARNLCPDRERATIAVGAAILALAVPAAAGQIGAIVAGGLIGWGALRSGAPSPTGAPLAIHLPRPWSVAAALTFLLLLFGLPALSAAVPSQAIALFDSFYRSGSLVFGGGHVVLPLLQAEVVPPGWVTNDAFLAGYGAAQAVPGPVHIRRLPRHGHGGGPQRLVGRADLPGSDLSAVVSAADRGAAVLEQPAASPRGAVDNTGCQRGRGGPVAGGALQAGVDERDLHAGRFRDWNRGLSAADALGGAAVARCGLRSVGGKHRCCNRLISGVGAEDTEKEPTQDVQSLVCFLCVVARGVELGRPGRRFGVPRRVDLDRAA